MLTQIVILSEAKNLGNITFMLPRFFTTLRFVLNENFTTFKIRNHENNTQLYH